MMMFAERLKQLRERRAVIQSEVAQAVGVPRSTYSLYENGVREPGLDALNRLADYFNVTTDYLLGRTAYDNVNKTGVKGKESVLNGTTQGRLEEVTKSLIDYHEKFSGQKWNERFFEQLTTDIVHIIRSYTHVITLLYQGKPLDDALSKLVQGGTSLGMRFYSNFAITMDGTTPIIDLPVNLEE